MRLRPAGSDGAVGPDAGPLQSICSLPCRQHGQGRRSTPLANGTISLWDSGPWRGSWRPSLAHARWLLPAPEVSGAGLQIT